MTAQKLTVEAGLDRKLISERGGSYRYLVVTLTAPDRLQDQAAPTVATNLALIIDASGSMAGSKLEAAKAAAMGVVERLGAADRLSLVSFATDVLTHLDALLMDEQGKRAALDVIGALVPRDMTNLAGGWLAGAKSIEGAMAAGGAGRNHLVLLTDGMANQGVVEPSVLAAKAAELLERGITSSAVGIGEDYSSDQIEAIGTAGGGGFDHASVASEITEIVLGRLGTIGAVTAEAVRVKVQSPAGVVATCLNRFPSRVEGDSLEVTVGGICGGASRHIVFRMVMPAGAAGTELPFSATAVWKKPGEQETLTAGLVEVTAQFASPSDLRGQARDAVISLQAARAWHADVLQRTLQLNRRHRFGEAVAFIREQVAYFERYCAGLEGTEELVHEMRRLGEHAGRRWGEGARKELSVMGSKASRSEEDYRRTAKLRSAMRILDDDLGQ